MASHMHDNTERRLIEAALYGDRKPLAAWIRDHGVRTKKARNVVADILEGKFNRPKHRPRRLETQKRLHEVVLLVSYCEAQRIKTEASVAIACEAMNFSRRR